MRLTTFLTSVKVKVPVDVSYVTSHGFTMTPGCNRLFKVSFGTMFEVSVTKYSTIRC